MQTGSVQGRFYRSRKLMRMCVVQSAAEREPGGGEEGRRILRFVKQRHGTAGRVCAEEGIFLCLLRRNDGHHGFCIGSCEEQMIGGGELGGSETREAHDVGVEASVCGGCECYLASRVGQDTPDSTLTRSSHATAAQDPLRPRLHTAQGGGRALGEERRRRLSPARLSLFEVL